jgi:ATP-dependent Clp protease ATP-binding subunit ClpA
MKIVLSDSLIKETAFRITSGHGKPMPFNEKALRRGFSGICGQEEICESLIKVLKLHSLHIRPLKKPLTMLFVGPSGVGKTEIARIIAKNCSGEKPIILNMSEYHSPASINRIIGSPAGYIGSDSNAELPFDALRSNPYQVILLDEFEKCDRAVQRLFMSVFDEGLLTANKGAAIDFSKAIIIATANAGCTSRKPMGFTCGSSSEQLSSSELSDYFDIELVNRFAHRYTFSEISKDTYRKIVEDKLHSELLDIGKLRPELNIDSLFDADELSAAAEQITETTYDQKLGARPALTSVNSYIDDKLLGSGLPV